MFVEGVELGFDRFDSGESVGRKGWICGGKRWEEKVLRGEAGRGVRVQRGEHVLGKPQVRRHSNTLYKTSRTLEGKPAGRNS